MNIRRWFRRKKIKFAGNGLFASLEELMAIRRYVPYMQSYERQHSLQHDMGEIKSAFKGRGMELEEIRAYNFGDDIRDIDWRVTAKKDTPYTKIYNEERDYEILAWVDLSAPMLFGSKNELKAVTVCKIAALLGWMAIANKDKFGCVIFDGKDSWLYKPQTNSAHLLTILKKISQIGQQVLANPQNQEQMRAKSLKMLELNAKNRATVFALSDFTDIDENAKKQFAALAKKSKLYVVSVYDSLEENPPLSGEYKVQYLNQSLVFDSNGKNYQADYRKYFADKRKRLNEFCRHFGCKLIEFRNDKKMRENLKIM